MIETYHDLICHSLDPTRLFRAVGDATDDDLKIWVNALSNWPDTNVIDVSTLEQKLESLRSLLDLATSDTKESLHFDRKTLEGSPDAFVSVRIVKNESFEDYHKRCGVPRHNSITQIGVKLAKLLRLPHKADQKHD